MWKEKLYNADKSNKTMKMLYFVLNILSSFASRYCTTMTFQCKFIYIDIYAHVKCETETAAVHVVSGSD